MPQSWKGTYTVRVPSSYAATLGYHGVTASAVLQYSCYTPRWCDLFIQGVAVAAPCALCVVQMDANAVYSATIAAAQIQSTPAYLPDVCRQAVTLLVENKLTSNSAKAAANGSGGAYASLHLRGTMYCPLACRQYAYQVAVVQPLLARKLNLR